MSTTGVAPAIDLSKTANCIFITTHFHMGIGRLRQVRDLDIQTTADKTQLRHQKKLIDSPELEEIRSQDGYLKRWLESKMCRYSDSTGFLPRTFLEEVDRAVLAYQTIRRPKLVAAFMAKYRAMEANDFIELKLALGELFVRKDYASADVVERGFEFMFSYRPVGKVDLEGISDVIIAREIEKEKSVRLQAVVAWRDAMRESALGMVDMLFDVLKPQADGKKRKLHESTVEKLQEFIETFDVRDLAGDTEYQQHIGTLREIMRGVNVEKLRHSDNLKTYVAAKLDTVRKEMSILVTGRKFR